MPEGTQERKDEKKPENETKKVLLLGYNMYAAAEGLKPAKPWDPMETDPLTAKEIGL